MANSPAVVAWIHSSVILSWVAVAETTGAAGFAAIVAVVSASAPRLLEVSARTEICTVVPVGRSDRVALVPFAVTWRLVPLAV
jgi:hypothetical protein